MDRQTIMETNKSLRTIKTELEILLEKGVIDDSAFDAIHAVLPAETPLRGAPSGARSNSSTPMQTSSAASTPPPPRSQAAAAAGPPSYEDTPAPGLPARSGKPVLSSARALYRYTGLDPRDLSLEKDDEILVHEHMNADWWFGRNQRTGAEGIFPQNYVLVQQGGKAPLAYAPPQQPTYGYPQQQQQQQQQSPYNSSVPPMAVAEGGGQGGQGTGGGKVGEYGKKFGKKLGNAAVFGAGATIGSNLVNSIF